jgi:hypothetical protein
MKKWSALLLAMALMISFALFGAIVNEILSHPLMKF